VSLRDAIRRFDAKALVIRMTPSPEMKKAVSKLEKLSDGLDEFILEPTPAVLATTVDALKNGNLPARRITKQMAMGGLPELSQVGNGQIWVKRFLDLVQQASSSVLTRCLLIGYLRIADENDSISTLLRVYLKKNLALIPQQWQRRIDRYDLLGDKIGDRVASEIITKTDLDPSFVMNDAGLRGILESCTFSENVFNAICAQLSTGHTDQRLSRFWRWVRPNNDQHILFRKSLRSYAEALLTPYVSASPTDTQKAAIQNFLLDVFRDPRVDRSSWRVVPAVLRNVFNRWLTEQSFELLMQIVSSSNDTTQWQERQKFWTPYIEAGHISDAWVVLGSKGASVATQLVQRGDLQSTAVYGLLRSGDVDPLHSMILLRIGDWVISEWTHSGKLRFYHQLSNKKAPKFYEKLYHASAIRVDSAADEAITHHSGWQHTARQFLANRIGVRVSVAATPVPSTQFKTPKSKGDEACVACGAFWPPIMLDVRGRCRRCNSIGYKIR